MQLNPHIYFCGECEEAFTLYAGLLGGTITTLLRYGGSPLANQVPGEWGGKIAHACLDLGSSQITGVDVQPTGYERPHGVSLLLGVDEPDQAERVFSALAEGGSVKLPIQQTFWSARYGIVVDRFGVQWEINCAQEPQKV